MCLKCHYRRSQITNRFKRAELFGKLINLFADLSSRAIETSSYFKAIVSGDSMNVERKHKDPFEFNPFCRLVFSANTVPTSADKTFAYYRRWIIIPFPYTFTGDKDDKSLSYKITRPQELSGLLNRALTGLRRLFTQKSFTDSQTVRDELDDYKKQNDTVAAFVIEGCEFDPEAEVERKEMFSEYCKYCKREGLKKIETNRSCYKRLRAYQEIEETQIHSGDRVFTGIRIKT